MAYLLLSILILFTAYLLLLPLSKRKPVLLGERWSVVLTLTLFATLASFSHPLVYLLAILLGGLLFFSKTWFIYGITRGKIDVALRQALRATRTSWQDFKGYYKIAGSMSVRVINFTKKIQLVLFRSSKFSQKANLAKDVFRKFVQNYHLEL